MNKYSVILGIRWYSHFFSFSNFSAAHWSHLRPVNMCDSYSIKNFYHNKALTSPYPRSHVERTHVPADKVDWMTEWKDYQPVEYTAVSILSGPQWADPQVRWVEGRQVEILVSLLICLFQSFLTWENSIVALRTWEKIAIVYLLVCSWIVCKMRRTWAELEAWSSALWLRKWGRLIAWW